MASLTLYDTIVPVLIRGLNTFDHVLTQAEKYAKEKNEDVNTYVQDRLVEDQLPLGFQVQNTSKAVQVAIGRLTGTEPAFFENNEKTIDDLHNRIKKTLDQLKALDVAQVNARAGQEVTVQQAVLTHNFPNFFFHITTAYSILRAKGVPLGKRDFIAEFLGF
ncbi:unnamed protein product [Clonostachys rhizophaga]|uniref:DUF1993 domain-containing protein n=1 Tax=Clonostachys rhizophaga TaxID=160324 RepID=A0A9N9V7Y2_9HYPO|nr:unnamed protein product [Clonostachys rhizophaga]